MVAAPPGTFLDGKRPLVRTTFEPDESQRREARRAIDVADDRTFDQDPEYGISALAEIGIKALSPAVNDPVTAIRVIDRMVRVLTKWGDASRAKKPVYDRVHVPPLDTAELYRVAFSQLASYGAGDARVGACLQRALRALSQAADPESAGAAQEQASRALRLAKVALVLEEDYERLCSINRTFMPG